MRDETKPRGEPCTCNCLQHFADDPNCPLRFDEANLMYQFTYQEPECDGLSMLLIHHCPFCGGKAPKSRDRS